MKSLTRGFLLALFSIFLALIFGSRLSYFIATFNGRYFPEPLLIIIALLVYLKFPVQRKPLIVNTSFALLVICIPLVFQLVYFDLSIDLFYRYFRCFAVFSFAFSLILTFFNSISFTLKSKRDFAFNVLIFSYSSLVFGWISTLLSATTNEVLVLFAGARTVQPDMAILTATVATLRLKDLSNYKKCNLKPSFPLWLFSLLPLLVFSYSANRSTLLITCIILILFFTINFVDYKKSIFYLKNIFILLLLIPFVFLLVQLFSADAFINSLSEIYNNLVPDSVFRDSSGFKWSRLSILTEQLERFGSTQESARANWYHLFLSNFYLFLLPSGYSLSASSQLLSESMGTFFAPYDSGLLMFLQIYGLIMGLPIIAWISILVYRYNKPFCLKSQKASFVAYFLSFLYISSNDVLLSSFFGAIHLSVFYSVIMLPLIVKKPKVVETLGFP